MLGCFVSVDTLWKSFYTLSVMYSPGPVNFMGLNAGLTGQFKNDLFFIGVGCAMLMLFMILDILGLQSFHKMPCTILRCLVHFIRFIFHTKC